jgi:hypothetical protein
MKLSDFFEDKYTVIFVLILVLLVSVWISRTYRNGGFSRWIAPSEGYGTGVIEGLAVADHEKVRYDGIALSQSSHAPTDTTGSRSDGTLILNKCSFVKDLTTTFRFLFTTTAELRGVNGANPAKIITIKVPTYYIKNTNATGMKVSMRAYGGTLPATVGTSAGSGAELDPSPSIAVTVPTSGADLGFCVITYTIGTANPMAAGKYALELSGLQWTDSVITPGTTAAPNAGLANVTLESNAEAAKLVLVNLWPSDSTNTKQLRIFDTTAYGGLATFLSCRKISTESPQLSPNYTGTATTFSMTIMLTNDLAEGDIFLVQVPYVTKTANIDLGISFVWTNPSTSLQNTLSSISNAGVVTSDVNTYGGGQNVVVFSLGAGGSLPKGTPIRLSIAGLQTPTSKTSSTTAKIRTYKGTPPPSLNAAFSGEGGVLDQGEYILPAIEARLDTATSSGTAGATSSGTASDGTTYVTSAASSVLISDVKRQMNWAIEAQKEYESANKALRAATTTTAKTEAQLKYDVAIARRNRLIASHPDSWYDGANWRIGDDGHVRKCVEPSNLSSNEGNCQNIFRMDASGNVVKSADGNNILLMRKCPWKCNNPGQTGSDACRIDADCAKVIRWVTYLPDGTQIEKNLLATTRPSYDDVASSSSSSAQDDDIYRRGITRNFGGYGRGRPPGQPPVQSPGLFGTIRDAAGNIIRGIGNWIDPNDPAGNQRTDQRNAYYYEDGSPAATAYLGMYNGQGYEEESPFYGASKPTSYYYTTNYYYTDGEAGGGADGGGGVNDGKSNMPGKLSSVRPYEQSINL